MGRFVHVLMRKWFPSLIFETEISINDYSIVKRRQKAK